MRKSVAIASILGVGGVLILTGCMDKASEPFKDAHVSTRDGSPAGVGTMPDGFSNYAWKCIPDSNTLVVSAFHGDQNRAAITAVEDPIRCP